MAKRKTNLQFFINQRPGYDIEFIVKYPDYPKYERDIYFELLYPFSYDLAYFEIVTGSDGDWVEEDCKEIELEALLTGPNHVIRFIGQLILKEGFDSFLEFVELVNFFFERREHKEKMNLFRKKIDPPFYKSPHSLNYFGIP